MENFLNSVLVCTSENLSKLILSLPVIDNLAKIIPNLKIYLLVSKKLYDVVAEYPNITELIVYDTDKNTNKIIQTQHLINTIKNLNIDKTLILHHDKEVISLLKLCDLKERYGSFENFDNFFSYTKGVWQYRDKCKKHELEYNLDLLKLLKIDELNFSYNLKLPLPLNLNFPEKFKKLIEAKSFIVINPLSSKEYNVCWKLSYYSELASRVYEKYEYPILFIGDKEDAEHISAIKKHVVGVSYNLAGELTLSDILFLISKAKLFIGCNSGAMHLASGFNIPVVSLFCNNKLISAKRWGPYSKNAIVVSPAGTCTNQKKCIGAKCSNYLCMDSIDVDEVFEKVSVFLDSTFVNSQMGFDFRGATL